MTNNFQKSISQAWYHRGPSWTYLFLPLAWLFQFFTYLRRLCYRLNIFKSKALNVPVIIVGNITVGGSGKTPLVLYLSQLLQENGYTPGIISRGYLGNCQQFPHLLELDDDATSVGDEPILLAKRSHCPVVIDPKRLRAAEYLLANSACDIIISDDGLQHYALKRDLEIVVIDGQRLFGNNLLLPAGPLRETRKGVNSADLLVINGADADDAYRMDYTPSALTNVLDPQITQEIEYFHSQPIHAVAAIGNPYKFFQQLRALGLTVIEHSFSDHFALQKNDLQFDDLYPIIMTEKDAVKCQTFADYQYWYLPIDAVLPQAFNDSFLKRLKDSSC